MVHGRCQWWKVKGRIQDTKEFPKSVHRFVFVTMAATDSKPSPTSQPVQQKENNASTDAVIPGKDVQSQEATTTPGTATTTPKDPATPQKVSKKKEEVVVFGWCWSA